MEQEKTTNQKSKSDKDCCPEHKKNPGALFIPAGILIGMGFGFVFNNLPAGLFIGLGAGFVAFAISMFVKK